MGCIENKDERDWDVLTRKKIVLESENGIYL
jgi:hypothetical protein